MSYYMMKLFLAVIAINVFAIGVLLLVLYNARINLRKKIRTQAFLFGIIEASKTSENSAEAAKKLRVSKEEFLALCKEKKIDTPEVRKEKAETEKKNMEAEQKRIMDEEAAWLSEQERIITEQKKRQDEEAQSRREKLRKFGFR